MSTRTRVRKVVKWGGVVVCAVLVWTCWFSSTNAIEWRSFSGRWCGVSAGQVELGFWGEMRGRSDWTGWRVETRDARLRWFFYERSAADGWRVAVPLWPLVVVTGLHPVFVIVRAVLRFQRWSVHERRRRAGQCVGCGYLLTGLAPGAVCPECGTAPKPA